MRASFCPRVSACPLGTKKTLPAGSWQDWVCGWGAQSADNARESRVKRRKSSPFYRPTSHLNVKRAAQKWCASTASEPGWVWTTLAWLGSHTLLHLLNSERAGPLTTTPHFPWKSAAHLFASKTEMLFSHDNFEDYFKDNEMQTAFNNLLIPYIYTFHGL